NFADVEVREYIDLYMYAQPSDNSFLRGDTITIIGYVENDGVFAAFSVEIHALVDGGSTAETDFTDAAGNFSIQLEIPIGLASGQYIITIESISPYRDVLSVTGSWIIIVVIDSTIDVRVSSASFMPEETFTIQLQLFDEDGAPINGASIEIYLNMTLIDTVILSDGSGSVITVTIPSTWSNNGYFVITVDFAGNTYFNGDSDVSADSIHIFTDIAFDNRSPASVTPGLSFIIEVRITDSDQNAIVDRSVILTIDGTNIVTLTTDAEGVISYNLPAHDEGIIRFSITLMSHDVPPVASGTFEIMIQTTGGNILQGTDLIIAGILLIGAVVAVLAYLYIVKGMFRSVVISRGIDIPTKLRNIKKLADAGKYGASITLAYRTFEQMCGTKMGSERTHSETAREYLDRVLKSIPLDGPTVEQFVQTYEEARFSHHEMTRERYEASLRIFTDIYPRIDTSALME
ncbi:MAG: DUF4129 domain-containing protein, partial [Candidatus Thorarchaeota archaeon]